MTKFYLKKILLSLILIIMPFLIQLKVLNQNIFLVIVLATLLFIINYNSMSISSTKKDKTYYTVFSFIFSLFQVIGYNCLNYETTKINQLNTWIYIVLLALSFYNVSKFLFNIRFNNIKDNKYLSKFFDNKYSFIMVFTLIILVWLPVIASFYPGNFAYDVITQLKMYTHEWAFTKYQPVIHTFLLGFFIKDANNLFLYSCFQTIIMALVFSYIIFYLNRKGVPKYLNLLFLLIYMFLPTHVIMAITTTKDVLFSGIFSVAIIKFIDMIEDSERYFKSNKNIITIILLVFVLLILRNNVLYALVVSIPIIIIILRKYYKKLLIISFGSLILYFSYDLILSKVFSIQDGPKSEMLSVIMQSYANVYNLESISLDEKEQIEVLFLPNTLEKFNSRISDPIKNNFNMQLFSNNIVDYLKLYLKLGLKYPINYIDSWFNMFYSYFYIYDELPQTGSKRYVEINCMDSEFNKSDDCSKNYIYTKYKSMLHEATYQDIPILRLFMNSAIYVWIIIITVLNIFRNKKYHLFVPLILLVMICLTNLLGPVALMRYVYPLFTSVPLIIYIFMKSNSKSTIL